MTDSSDILRKLGMGRTEEPVRLATSRGQSTDEEAECGAFGYLRGLGDHALHIEFRLATGNVEAFPYSWLGPYRYNPSSGLELNFVGDQTYRVVIAGRNLDTLVGGSVNLTDRGILRHRVTWVREMEPEETRSLPDSAVVVEHITVQKVKADAER